jgi:hypothetical protein
MKFEVLTNAISVSRMACNLLASPLALKLSRSMEIQTRETMRTAHRQQGTDHVLRPVAIIAGRAPAIEVFGFG